MSGSMDMERVKLEQRVHTLQFQNQKLSAQLEVRLSLPLPSTANP